MASTGIRRSRPSPAAAVTVVAGIVGTLVAGCATLPSSSAPRQVTTGANAVQAYVRPLPPPPPSSGLYTTAQDAVLGFLSASATYAYDPAAARQFLSPNLRKTWRPGPVTVVTLGPTTQSSSSGQALTCGGPATCSALTYASVDITAQHLATLGSGGQYEYSAGTSTYSFQLAEVKKDVWLITKLPQGPPSLLLTKASFQEVYQPRNLFFFARPAASVVNGELVPDPVYAPLQSANNALNTDVAIGLIKGLLSDRHSWLSDATTTAFPPRTKLVKVTLRGQTAIVDLSGSAKGASSQRIDQMEAQLQATLTNKAYSSPLARNVELEINGRLQYPGATSNIARVIPGNLVYQSSSGTVSQLDGRGQRSQLAGPAQIGSAQITALASTEVGAFAVAVQSGGGCAVYFHPPTTGPLGGPYPSGRIPGSTGPCTSLSWDRNGNLWAVAGGHIWLMGPQARYQVGSQARYRWLTVSPPKLPSDGRSGPRILSVQMAPDGVRAALLVQQSGGKSGVMLAAVVVTATEPRVSVALGTAVPAWAGLSHPTALSWYSAYDLVVLTRTGIWQVPLTGGAGRLLGAAPAGAVSLASNGVDFAVGTSDDGQYAVETSSNGSNPWKRVALSTFPSYATYSTYPN